MSTRALIARPEETDGGIAGVYLHLDGYPSRTGKMLYARVGDAVALLTRLDRVRHELVDAHPAGYSALRDPDSQGAVECYCHSRGEGTDRPLIHDPAPDWAEYTYLLADEGLTIARSGDHVAFTVPWCLDNEPDWAGITGWLEVAR